MLENQVEIDHEGFDMRKRNGYIMVEFYLKNSSVLCCYGNR